MTQILPIIGRLRGVIHDLNADQRWTGDELAAAVGKRATILANLPDSQGGTFAIFHANSLNFFADLFAVWSVGGVAACLNPGLSAPEQQVVLDHLKPVAALTDGAEVVGNTPILTLATHAEPTGIATAQQASLDSPALLLFTSGTTGAPKAVSLSHRAVLSRLALNTAQIGAETLSRTLSILPTYFGHGLIGNALTPLAAGGSLWLMPEAGIGGAARLGEVIDSHQISFMSSVPSYWKIALRASAPPQSSSLKRVHIGSAPLSADLWSQIIEWSGAECVNTYGITETANWIGGASSQEFAPEDGLIGRPWGGLAAVRTENGLAAVGEGELMLQVPSLMTGYLGRDDLTAEVLDNGWYATGDLGRIGADGVMRLTGRAKHLINKGGIKLYPEEFDLLLERHPEITEACAFAVPDPISGEDMAIAVTLVEGADISAQTIRTWMQDQVRPDAMPAKIHIVDAIPKTSRGKINRAAVAEHCVSLEAIG